MSGYVLQLAFDGAEQSALDVEPHLWGPAFAPLREDCARFCQVRTDPKLGTIACPGNLATPSKMGHRKETP